MRNKTPCYTTPAGVRIGCQYESPLRPFHDRDALRLQSALLNQRPPIVQRVTRLPLLSRLWSWC